MDQSQPMQEFAAKALLRASDITSPKSSLVRNYSEVSLSEIGDDKCFTLTKALGYHAIHGRL